jgi:glycosyltransferase domain-containing protein
VTPRLTLLCPSFQRHHYLERSCRFWGDRDNVYIFYADGSQSPLESASINAKNIKYSYKPVDIQQRILYLLDQVQTPYVCMMGDDELYIPSSLASCVEFLDSHPDYVACMGRAIGFSRQDDMAIFRSQYPKLRARNLASEAPLHRLTEHFATYVPAHCYAVTRADVFKEAMGKALQCKLDLFAISELIEEFLVISKGKTCVLPELYWLRSHEAPPIRNTGDRSLDPSKLFNYWWLSQDPFIVAERLAFCSELALASHGAVTHEEVDSILDCHVKNAYGREPAFGGWMRDAIIKRIKSVAPEPIANRLKTVRAIKHRITLSLKDPVAQSHAALQELRNQGVVIDEAGLTECVAAIEASWRR